MFNPIEIQQEKYHFFCKKLQEEIQCDLSLKSFREQSFCHLVTDLCSNIFSDEIKDILDLVNDPEISIASIDVPKHSQLDSSLDVVLGAAVVFGIFCKIGSPNIEPINNLPFSIHTASHTNSESLDSLGLDQDSLEVKHGFHNDGLISDSLVEIPNHIFVYNLHISYQTPGDFFWVPISTWSDAEHFGLIADEESMSASIKLTPNYYRENDGNIKNSFTENLIIPLSIIDKNGKRKFFLNGQVGLNDNPQKIVDFVNAMRISIENCPKKISIPQRERRAIYFKNSMGFHARDIFKHPIEGVDLTRVFLRAVDLNSEKYLIK